MRLKNGYKNSKYNVILFLLCLHVAMPIASMDFQQMAQVIMPMYTYSSGTQQFFQQNNSLVPPHIYADDVGGMQAGLVSFATILLLSGYAVYQLNNLKREFLTTVDAAIHDRNLKRARNEIRPVTGRKK